MNFVEGQVVYLKSGGPPMTIETLDKLYAYCIWHDGRNMRAHKFDIRSLVTAKPDYSAITRSIVT